MHYPAHPNILLFFLFIRRHKDSKTQLCLCALVFNNFWLKAQRLASSVLSVFCMHLAKRWAF
jgi:hypothetical protein